MLISEAETQHAICIKGAKANCTSIIAEAENCCSTAIRKAEFCGTQQAHSIQQSHTKGMQHLDTEDIGEEGKDHLSFLTTCGAAPQRPRSSGDPLPPAPGKCALVYSTKHSPQYLLLDMHLSHWLLILLPHGTWALSPIQMAKALPQSDCIPTSIRSHPQEWPLRSHPI